MARISDDTYAMLAVNLPALTDYALIDYRGRFAAASPTDPAHYSRLVVMFDAEVTRRGITLQQQADLLWLGEAVSHGTPRD